MLVGSGTGVGTGVLVGSGEGVGGGKVGIAVLVVTKDGDDSEPDEPQAIASNNRPVASIRAVRVVSSARIPAGLCNCVAYARAAILLESARPLTRGVRWVLLHHAG